MTDEDESPGSNGAPANAETNIGRWWRRVTHRLGGGPQTRDELLDVLKEACDDNLIDSDALAMFVGVLETDELQVRDIMVPRSQMVVLESDWSLEQLLAVVVDSGHSRFPVIGDSRDEVVGILLAKDLLKFASPSGLQGGQFSLQQVLRSTVFVPESKRVNVLLKDFRGGRNHMAIVVDEYGGVAGLVTIEDVLETIVGDIDDEYDDAEAPSILRQDERRYLVNSLTTIEEFNEHFQAELPDEEFDTVGGLVMHALGHLPKRGESVTLGRYHFNVQRADGRRVQLLQVTVSAE